MKGGIMPELAWRMLSLACLFAALPMLMVESWSPWVKKGIMFTLAATYFFCLYMADG